MKQKLDAALVLQCPNVSKPFQLHINLNSLGLGQIPTQNDDYGWEYVVAYVLRSNNTAEANYLFYKEKTLAVVWAIVHFRQYLYDQRFTLLVDHQHLLWLMELYKLTSKLVMWVLLHEEYDFGVLDRSNITYLDSNGLSCNSIIWMKI